MARRLIFAGCVCLLIVVLTHIAEHLAILPFAIASIGLLLAGFGTSDVTSPFDPKRTSRNSR